MFEQREAGASLARVGSAQEEASSPMLAPGLRRPAIGQPIRPVTLANFHYYEKLR